MEKGFNQHWIGIEKLAWSAAKSRLFKVMLKYSGLLTQRALVLPYSNWVKCEHKHFCHGRELNLDQQWFKALDRNIQEHSMNSVFSLKNGFVNTGKICSSKFLLKNIFKKMKKI